MDKAELLFIEGVNVPFAIFKIDMDGKCGIHNVVTGITPSIPKEGITHAQRVKDLRDSILKCQLGLWSEITALSIQEDSLK